MNLLERYLQAIGQYLPLATRDDVLAELRANLLDQIDARAEELHRPLTDAELTDLLRAHGRPEVVAVRYLPQRSLIGPAIFPTYLLTLRKALPFVALIYAIAQGTSLIFGRDGRPIGSAIAGAVFQFVPTLILFWGIVTMIFAAIEYHQADGGTSLNFTKWDPTKLPPLTSDTQTKARSFASRVVDLVVHCCWMTYVSLIPRHPYIVIGPGAEYFSKLNITWSPAWHTFYFLLIALLTIQLVIKIIALINSSEPWKKPLELLTKLLSAVAVGVLAFSSTYLVPADLSAKDFASLALAVKLESINHAINLSFRIVLFIVVLQLLIDLWKYLRPKIPSTGLAF